MGCAWEGSLFLGHGLWPSLNGAGRGGTAHLSIKKKGVWEPISQITIKNKGKGDEVRKDSGRETYTLIWSLSLSLSLSHTHTHTYRLTQNKQVLNEKRGGRKAKGKKRLQRYVNDRQKGKKKINCNQRQRQTKENSLFSSPSLFRLYFNQRTREIRTQTLDQQVLLQREPQRRLESLPRDWLILNSWC